jgi:predicted CXXCH cytochrome family protein
VRALWLAVLLACGGKPAAPGAPANDRVVSSNVLREDYAGSETCADCHAEIYKAWAASPMRNMTRDAATATIRAPFDGATLTVGVTTAKMTMSGTSRVIEITSPRGTEQFRVTKVIGGRYREDFVGLGHGKSEYVLPVTYVFATRSWRYKGYSVMVKERPEMSVRAVWSQECIACHNTMPLAFNLYDDLYGPDLPGYQAKLSDRTLPKSLAWTARIRDDARLATALEKEIAFLGGEPTRAGARALIREAAATTQDRLDGRTLVELGIGCEACHNGSKQHVDDPRVLPSFGVQSSMIGLAPPKGQEGTRAQWINHTCAKCHTVLFTRYPYTWEGGRRRSNPGGSTTNSGEGRDYKLGGCASAMACTTCHDPHAEDPRAKLDAMATPAGNVLCAGCHEQIAAAVTQHSHHKAGSAGTSCVACHMPKKNMGLDYSLVRYHRIGSATDGPRVSGDRPLECALCHADKSVESLVTTMEQWWKKKFDRSALRALYGEDLGVNAIRATLIRGKPHEQAAAIGVLGETRDRSSLAILAPMLAHEYPLVRYYAKHALELITGAPIAIDVNAPALDLLREAQVWLKTQK